MLVLQYKFSELLSHFELCIQVLPIKYQYLQTGSYFGQIKKQTKIVSWLSDFLKFFSWIKICKKASSTGVKHRIFLHLLIILA